jgi:hypothetical protein
VVVADVVSSSIELAVNVIADLNGGYSTAARNHSLTGSEADSANKRLWMTR